MPQTSAQRQAGDISKEREEQILERLKELERELFTVEVFRDRKRYEETRELFLLHKALLIDVLGGSVILLLTFLRQTDVDRFYHNHYRVGEGSLSQQLSHILISEHLQDKVKGAQLIVRLQVKHEDHLRVRDRLGRGLERTTSVDNLLLALPPPNRQVDHSSLRSLDLAVVGREEPCTERTDDVSTLKFTVKEVQAAMTKAGESSRQVEVWLQTMRGQLETARQEEDAMRKEVARMRQEEETVQEVLSECKEKIQNLQEVNRTKELELETMREDIKAAREQTQATVFDSVTKETAYLRKKDEEAQISLQKQQEEIQQLQVANKSMAATIEELLYEKHTAKGPSQDQGDESEGGSHQLKQPIAEKELRKIFHRFSQNVIGTREVEDLGVALGLTADEMTSIIQGSKNQTLSFQAYNVLLKWMEKDREASIDKLQQELSDFGMDMLAEEVCRIKTRPGQQLAGTSAGLAAKRSAAGQSSHDGHQEEQLTQLLEQNRTLRALVEELQGKKPRSRVPGAKPVVLLLNDEYGTAKGGVSTVHGQMAALLASKGAEVYSTVLSATEDNKKDAAADGVQLIFPTTSQRDKREPCLDWLTFDHKARYPDLPTVDFIVGHVPITSHAAKQIKEQRFPDAKLVQVTHVMPEDTNPYKSDERVLSIGGEWRNILEDLEHADVIISVGPYLHDYYKLETRGFEPHHEFLPKPSDIFSTARVKYVDAGVKVVLSIGRVKGVERLKGYDLDAKSMGKVIVALPNTKWRARGISAEDFQESRDIIQANAGKIHFTPLEYGTQKELCRDMEKASVVLMPSRAEPFGLVGLEAIAAGVPVLVSHKSGLAMFLKTQDPEFDRTIVEIEDDDDEAAKTLAKRIIKILKDGPREFQVAQRLKERLLASEYWAASHTKFLESFGLEG
ncbi:uncharacterized protein LOC144887988 [Branchiostoma floridae x Branchiostoma japonicum]